MRVWERVVVAALWLGCIFLQDVTSFRLELSSSGTLMHKLRRDTRSAADRFSTAHGLSKRKCAGFPCMFSHIADHAGSASMRKLNKQLLFDCISDPNCFTSGKKRSYDPNPPAIMSGDYEEDMTSYEPTRGEPYGLENDLGVQDYLESPEDNMWDIAGDDFAWDGSAGGAWGRGRGQGQGRGQMRPSSSRNPSSERRQVYSQRYVRRTGAYP